jgi:hypothetical protein
MPGALTLVLVAIMFTTVGGKNFVGGLISHVSEASSIGSGIVFLVVTTVLSWCIGMLLTPIGCSIHALFFSAPTFRRFYMDHREALNNAVKCKFLSDPKNANWISYDGTDIQNQAQMTYQELHDGLKEKFQTAKANLAKSQAERVFYECTSASLMILIVVCILLMFHAHSNQPVIAPSQPAFSLIFALIILMFILSVWGQWFKANRLWIRQASLLSIYLNQPSQQTIINNNKTQKTLNKANQNAPNCANENKTGMWTRLLRFFRR